MTIPRKPSPHAPKPDFPLPKDWDKLVNQLADELAKRLRPTPPARLLTFRVIRIRRKGNMNICDLVIGWVPAASGGVTVQHFAATVTPPTAGAAPVGVTQDVGPTVATLTITAVPDGASVQVSVISDNGVVQSLPLDGSYSVNLTAPPSATAMTFTPTNVRVDDGSVIAIGAAAPAAPATPVAPATTPDPTPPLA
jgi:hypothetical protein